MTNVFFYILIQIIAVIFHDHQIPHQECGTSALMESLRNANPASRQREKLLEKQYAQTIRHSQRSIIPIYTLPVVVHIIHQGGGENISDAQVYQALDNLNAAFQNQGYYNPDTGADMQIEFCLAQRDTVGNATNGIIRYQSPVTNMAAPYSHADVAALATWNTQDYINIRVVKEACINGNCAPVGYAYLPPFHGWAGDGLVVEANNFGPEPENTTTLIHEMGHYLGLLHTFAGGCPNGDCLSTGDGVCDTPPDNATGAFPCELSFNSCTTDSDDPSVNNPFREPGLGGLGDQADMHQNYMDYGYHYCRDRFTAGQRDRMHFFIENVRQSLLESRACMLPCPSPPEALFTLAQNNIEAGGSILPSNMSNNATSYNWYINDSLVSQEVSPMLSIEGEGVYIIRLEAESSLPECGPASYELPVYVYCSLQAGFNYSAEGNWLSFTGQPLGADSYVWEAMDAASTLIFESTQSIDSIDISGLSFVQVCLTAMEGYCVSRICQNINLTPDGAEICDNGLDDDGDGLVDSFDPDCPCNNEQYQAYCPVECEYLPESFPEFEMEVEWISEITSNISDLGALPVCKVGDINNDGLIEVVAKASTGLYYGIEDVNNSVDNKILILNGEDGTTELEFNYVEYNGFNTNDFAIADIDSDNNVEIFVIFRDTTFCFNNSGGLLWKIYEPNTLAPMGINFADFNGDGVVELYFSNRIYNASTGVLLAVGDEGAGCSYTYSTFDLCLITHSIAADLLPSPGLELGAGNTVYQVEINNTAGMTGNSMIPVLAPPEVPDGNTSVGDIDGDGLLDMIVVKSDENIDGQGGLYVWDPRDQTVIATAESGDLGGVAFIGDVNGDCTPEIGMTFSYELRMYEFNGSSNLQLLYNLSTSDESGRTGITMFDFNQDGQQELVYRDETQLRILEGATGATLSSFPMRSGTGFEYPVITDIDGDGEAEILIEGYQEEDAEGNRDLRLYCFGSASTPWAPARSVWNQYAYNVTNVNDDLTIPRYPQSPAAPLEGYENCLRPTCPAPYNNFLAQATYRTQEGCVQFPAADFYLEILNYSCTPDSLSICAEVGNIGNRTITAPVDIALYDGNPLMDNQQVIGLHTMIFPGLEVDTICIMLPQAIGLDSLYLSINDTGGITPTSDFPVTDIVECDYSNNLDGIALQNEVMALNLGPDITKCESEVITLNAGSGFASYLWNDGTIDSLYSSSAAGLHFVEVTDQCGRVYSDSVLFVIDDSGDIELGPSILACPGEALSFQPNGDFDFIYWYPSQAVDCDSCLSVNVITNTSLSLIAVAGNGNCYSSDTVTITVNDPVMIQSSATICEGDTLIYNGQLLTQSGTYEFPFSGCDSLEVLELLTTNVSSNFDTLQICAGDSVSIFGQWITQDTVLQEVYTNVNGCDSTQAYIVEVNDLVHFGTSFDLCPGDSVQFSGQWYDTAGMYQQIVPAIIGCDTLYEVQINELFTSSNTDSIAICAGNSVLIFGNWINHDTVLQGVYINIVGCDSLQSYVVNVIPLPQAIVSYDLCPGDSVQFNGQWFSTPGIYQLLVPATMGCDTLYEVQINELFTSSNTDSIAICAGDSVLIFGNWISHDTVLQEVFTNVVGCDSLQTYVVSVNALPQASVSFDLCPGDSVQFNGQWYSTAGMYQQIVPAIMGCDTSYEVQINELFTSSNTDSIAICTGDSVEIFGNWISQDTVLQEVFTNVVSCDSLQTYVVSVTALPQASVSFDLCLGDSVQFSGQWYDTAGMYQQIVPAIIGCDTLYEVQINELFTSSNTDSIAICAGDSVLIFGNWISQDTILQEVFTNVVGCDSLQTYVVSVNALPQAIVSYELCPGDSVQFNDQWYSAAGMYQQIIPAIMGCDTAYEVQINELSTSSNTDSIAICAGDSVLIFGNWISHDTVLQEVFTNVVGCDGLQTYVVSVNALPQAIVSYELCPGDSVQFNDQWYSAAGMYQQIIPAIMGCDTAYEVQINELSTSSNTDSIAICAGDSVLIFGNWISHDTVLQEVFTNVVGCDSLQTYVVSVNALPQAIVSYDLCPGDSVQFNGQWFSTPGIYQLLVPATMGCDTLYEVQINELFTSSNTDSIAICSGDSVLIFGNWISHDTVLQGVFTNIVGCDSLQTYVVSVSALPQASVSYDLCPGDSVQFNDQWYNEEGVQQVLVSSVLGCDTLYTLIITELDPVYLFDTLELCQGDTHWLYDNWITSEGWYQDTLPGTPCAVYSNTWVEVIENSYGEETIILCPGDSVFIEGQWISEAGEISQIYTNAVGCDSIHQIEITVIEAPPPPQQEIDCEQLAVKLLINAPVNWSAAWSNGDTTLQTTYVGADTAYLTLATSPNCIVDYKITLPLLPEASDIPSLSDTTLQEGSRLFIQLGLEPEYWQVYWGATVALSCDTCFSAYIDVAEDMTVELMLIHTSGCVYETQFEITAEATASLYVPNAFSPNDDGVNDVFEAYGNQVEINGLKIFDRWGGLMYESNGSTPSWDGFSNGKKAEEGVYVYVIEYTDLHLGKEKIASGDFLLIR